VDPDTDFLMIEFAASRDIRITQYRTARAMLLWSHGCESGWHRKLLACALVPRSSERVRKVPRTKYGFRGGYRDREAAAGVSAIASGW
jgi:hypothetical protein